MKKLPAIFIVLVFLMAQYGRYASYMYCRMESKMPDCDCEKMLVSTNKEEVQFAEVVFSPKWEEQMVPEIEQGLPFLNTQPTLYLSVPSEEEVQGYPDSCFRPPSLS